MLFPLHQALSGLVILLLVTFTLRRFVMIVAAKNEEECLPQLLTALDEIEYSPGKICYVVVNDGSRDATGKILESWAASRPNARFRGVRRQRREGPGS